MFALLIWQSISGKPPNNVDIYRNVNRKNTLDTNALFNLCLWGSNCDTFTAKGFYAALRLYDENDQIIKTVKITQEKYNSKKTGPYLWGDDKTEKICMYYDTTSDDILHTFTVKFWFMNFKANSNFKLDFGIYGNTNYGPSRDKVKLKKILKGDAVKLEAGDKSVSFLLRKHSVGATANDDFAGDVSKINLGYHKDTETLQYPYFDDSNLQETDGQNSAFSFSWQNITIPPGKSHDYGFMVFYGDDFRLKPKIKDITPNINQLPKTFDLKFEVTEYEKRKVSLTIKDVEHDNNDIPCDSKDYDGIIQNQIFTCQSTFKDKQPTFRYKPVAEIAAPYNIRSNDIEPRTATYQGVNPPTLTITTAPVNNTEYYDGDSIDISGQVEDEVSYDVKYQWDKQESLRGPHNEKNIKSFNLHVPIPDKLSKRVHYLSIWAEDDLKIPSQKYVYQIVFSSENRPKIRTIYFNVNKLEANQENTIVIFGEGKDPNSGSNISIWMDNDGNTEFIGNFTSIGDEYKTFAFYHKLPSKQIGLSNFSFYVKDPDGHVSKERLNLTLEVWNSKEAKPPAVIPKIVDATNELKSDSKALFNVKYQNSEFERPMTHNNEGFFCAFKTFYNGSTDSFLFTHSEPNGKIEKDNFTMKLSISEEEKTHFLKVAFNVTNHNYFARRFDLSLFASTILIGSDSSITRSNRGISVKTDKNNMRYTIFTEDYYYKYPNANLHYIDYVPRSETEPISPDQLIFFGNTVNSGNSPNSIGISWTGVRIPGNSSTIFAIVFAGFDRVKTPTRLIDKTVWKDHYNSQDQPTLSLNIIDAEMNEEITLKIQEDDKAVKNEPFTIRKQTEEWTHPIKFPDGAQKYTIKVYAIENDETTGFPSNTIEKTVYIRDPPILKLDPVQGYRYNEKLWYNHNGKITISGSVSGTHSSEVGIYYRFLKSGSPMIEGAEILAITVSPTNNEGRFNFDVPFDLLTPSDYDYQISIYAKDGEVMSDMNNIAFNLNEYNPPKLYQAGLSKKSAKVGESILGYVAYDDAQNDFINVYIKVGSDSQFGDSVAHIDSNPTPGEQYPYAFFWTVPQLTPGVHDVIFEVRDSENNPSNQRTVTLFVRGN